MVLDKQNIERKKLEPENLVKETDYGFTPTPVEYKRFRLPLWVRFKARTGQIWGVVEKMSIFAKENPKLLFTLIRTYMAIKPNQTSTKAGVVLLVTILGLFGIHLDPDLLSEQAVKLVEGIIAVGGSATAIWAIFKDDEKETPDVTE